MTREHSWDTVVTNRASATFLRGDALDTPCRLEGLTVTEARRRTRLRTTVVGMHCSVRADVVERALRKQPGVHDVSLNLPDEQALIEYDRDASQLRSCSPASAI